MLVDRVEASAIAVEIWQCLRESNMIWLQESWKEDHEKKDELNTSCKPPDETKAKKKRTKAWRFRKYQMERRNFVPRLRNVNVNLCFFPVLHFASLIYGNPLFGCYKGLRLSSSRLYIFKQYVYSHGQFLVWRVAIYCWLWHWDVEDFMSKQ